MGEATYLHNIVVDDFIDFILDNTSFLGRVHFLSSSMLTTISLSLRSLSTRGLCLL
jgi:hypothetical protein